MKTNTDLNGEDSKNLLPIVVRVSEQFLAKHELFCRTSQLGMPLTTFLEYNMDESVSPHTPPTLPTAYLLYQNLSPFRSSERYVVYIEDIHGSTDSPSSS